MSAMKTLLLTLVLALVACSSAHRHEYNNNFMRAKRADPVSPASSCSYMTCATSGSTCGVVSPGQVKLCIAGEHCSGGICTANFASGATCNPGAIENQCAQGRCVDSGNGPICQLYQELMPGSSCTADSQCYPSSASGASSCVNNICVGRNSGDACSASYHCNPGTYCSSATGMCTPLGGEREVCASDSECSSRLSCLGGACTAHFSQIAGASCRNTINCAPGLYCSKSTGVCTNAIVDGFRTNQRCAINSSTSCGADLECSCNGFTTAGQVATCAPIQGTYPDMPNIEKAAFACIDQNACGSDLSNAATIDCISKNCLASYCTYFTRTSNDLFADYPSCLLDRMVDGASTMLRSCKAYAPVPPSPSTSAGNVIGASLAWAVLIAAALFFFEL